MRFPLLLPRNASNRPRRHVGAHRRASTGHAWQLLNDRPPVPPVPPGDQLSGRRRGWRRLGAAGVVAGALAVLVGLGGCGPDNTGSAPSSSPVAVASPSDSPSGSPSPTAVAVPPPTTAAAAPLAVPTTRAAAPPPVADPTTPAGQQQNAGCGGDYYVNSDGNCVHRPVQAPGPPAGATAKCNDGSYSFSQHRQGTCSGHGGVATWL